MRNLFESCLPTARLLGIAQVHHLWCSPPSVLYLLEQPDFLRLLLHYSFFLSLSFFSSLPFQCSSVCHGGCLNKQTREGPWRARRRDVRLFALVAPVWGKVFLRGTQRSGAQRSDHKTNIYPPASSAWALSSLPLTRKMRMDSTSGSEGRERCGPLMWRGLNHYEVWLLSSPLVDIVTVQSSSQS